ncbi:MAG: ankyrin repeat domain-containing protein [Bdellovibrionota bacterium]
MLKTCTLAVFTLVAIKANATTPVIYGEDNRQEVYEATPMNQALAASAATMIEKSKLTKSEDKPGLVQVEQTTLRTWLEAQFDEQKSNLLTPAAKVAVDQRITFCAGEKFTEQPNAGVCSGFLVGPDLLVTAGHCVAVPDFCEKYDWVFDFKVDAESKTAGVDVKEANVYSCKKVISNALTNSLGLDYGLIQLDRKVKGRKALNVRSEGKIADGSGIVVIGSPSGLPLKVAAGANVRKNLHPFYFAANLDTFQGNSGSAVFNAESGVVEGILVRGEEDFEANTTLMCIEAKKCADGDCRGEDVSRMTSIPEIAVKDALFRLAEKGDVKELEKLTKTRFWIDIYGVDGRTALMKATVKGHVEFLKKLIEKGADVKIQDAEGNSALHLLAATLNKKSTNTLNEILKAGGALEAKNDSAETALLVAARSLNYEAVRILIKNGADKNAVNDKNENVLFAFSRNGDNKSVKELIAIGVDASVRNADGQTAQELKKPGLFARWKK